MAQQHQSSTQDQETLPEKFSDLTVIDIDVHVGSAISRKELAAHMDEPHKSRTLHESRNLYPKTNWDREMGGKIRSVSFSDADDLYQQLCADFGVDYPILNTLNGLNKIPQEDLAVSLMKALNNVLLDKFVDQKDNFKGLITVGTQNPEASAEEIDRLATENDIVGAYIATGGPMYPLGDAQYDIIYKTAEDHDLPIVYHGHAGAFNTDFTRQNQAVNNFFTVHPLAHAWNQMLTVASLLGNGTPAKFPDLNFVFLEAGISWAPYMMFRYNKEYAIRRREVPLLDRSPESYMRDQFYFSTQPIGEPEDPADIQRVIELVRPESIMFSTDYPHWDFDNPEAIADIFRATSDKDLQKVFYDNAKSVFNLPV